MSVLHERWMDEPGPTDVLSFPMDELRPGTDQGSTEPGLLGDVVICPAVASKQAAAAGHGQREELGVLLTQDPPPAGLRPRGTRRRTSHVRLTGSACCRMESPDQPMISDLWLAIIAVVLIVSRC